MRRLFYAPAESPRPMAQKETNGSFPLAPLLAQRRSGRAYDPERPVARRQLLALLEAARWAPSCYGDEPWRYLVFERDRERRDWEEAVACLSDGNRWAAQAPLLLLSVASGHFQRNGQPNRWAQHDTGAASENLCLQAVELGLMAHQMGGFDPERARRVFAIPESFTPMAMIAVGYALPPARIPEELRERESAPRRRAPLAERCFAGRWGRPFAADGQEQER